jgi:diacylglycerol O-acyltransferase / wax synthase
VDNRLDYIDQASFVGLQVLGRGPLIQHTWIYDRPVDIDGLRSFHRNLGHGLLGRLIESSPFPLGRHRWVSSPGPAGLELSARDRPRDEVWAWADETACLPIHPGTGPAWRLAVQPLTNGGAAVALVVSHTTGDALAINLSIADAVNGVRRDLDYPPPGSRTRRSAFMQDGAAAARAIPDAAKAAVGAARIARAESDSLAASVKPSGGGLTPGKDHTVIAPCVIAYFEAEHWDSRSKILGGTSNSLFAGLAARLGQMLGRVDDSGRVKLTWPVNDRIEGDTRANALTTVFVTADPAKVTESLGELRADIKDALTTLSQTRTELLAPLPLVPFIPKPLARVVEKFINQAGSPVGCSNIGEFDPAVNRPDGTDADYLAVRLVEPQITAHTLDRMGGLLFVVSGRVREQIFVTVTAWIPGGPNTKDGLRGTVRQALAEFGLNGIVE